MSESNKIWGLLINIDGCKVRSVTHGHYPDENSKEYLASFGKPIQKACVDFMLDIDLGFKMKEFKSLVKMLSKDFNVQWRFVKCLQGEPLTESEFCKLKLILKE